MGAMGAMVAMVDIFSIHHYYLFHASWLGGATNK
jgi:hypothetical protein